MSKSIVVALVLNYRTPQLTYECLRSLQEEGLTGALVVDNSDDDGRSADELAKFLAQQPLSIKVDMVYPGENLGFAAGVNAGLRAIRERYLHCDVLLINSDARATQGMLSIMQGVLEAQSGPALVDAEQIYQDRPHVANITHYHRAMGLLLHRWIPGAFRYLSGCCLLIPETIARAPLFDEDFFIYGEDIELSWRLRRGGTTLIHATDAQVIHGGGKSTRPGSFFYEYHMLRGHLLLAHKTADGLIQSFIFLLLRFPVFSLRAVWRSLRSMRLTPIKAGIYVLFGRGKNRVLPL